MKNRTPLFWKIISPDGTYQTAGTVEEVERLTGLKIENKAHFEFGFVGDVKIHPVYSVNRPYISDDRKQRTLLSIYGGLK